MYSQSSFRLTEIGSSLVAEAGLGALMIAVLILPLVWSSRTRPLVVPGAAVLTCVLVGAALTVRPIPTAAMPGPSERVRTVVLITLDTFRRDHLSAMPDALAPDLTPNLDALASESVLFTDAYTTAPLTLPSHTTLFTGLAPEVHGVLKNGLMIPADFAAVPTALSEESFVTGAFTSSLVLHGSQGLAQWFRTYRNPPASLDLTNGLLLVGPLRRIIRSPTRKLGKTSGATTVDQAVGWLWSVPRDRSVFLWVHLYDAHVPYFTHYDAGGFSTWEALADPCDWSAHPTAVRQPPKHPMIPWAQTLPALHLCEQKTWEKLKIRSEHYAQEVRFLDRQVGRLLRKLDEVGRQDASIIVAADHGESLVEHQFFTSHQHSLYEPVMRVPLMIRNPDCGDCAGMIRQDGVSTLRVAATIRALAGLPADPTIAGPSLLEATPETAQVAIGPAPIRFRRRRKNIPLQAVARSDGRKVLIDNTGHVERYALEVDALERTPLMLGPEQESFAAVVAAKLEPPIIPISRDPVRNMLFGGAPPKHTDEGLADILSQPGVLGQLITTEQADEFVELEELARAALQAARKRGVATDEGISDEVKQSLEDLGYLQ